MYEKKAEIEIEKQSQKETVREEVKYYHKYEICLKKRTPDDRKNWCGLTFNSNYILKKKCNVSVKSYKQLNYCNVCCKKNVPSIQKLDLYHCEKSCNSLSITSSSEATKISWHRLCFVSPDPERNLYSYCDNNFSNVILRQNCKIDGCRMCCVNSDNILHTNMSMKSLNECFTKCAKGIIYDEVEFAYDPNSSV